MHEVDDDYDSDSGRPDSLAVILKAGKWDRASWPSHVPLREWKNKGSLTKNEAEWDVFLDRSDHELSDSHF